MNFLDFNIPTAAQSVARTGVGINLGVAQDLTPLAQMVAQERNVVTPMPGRKPDAAPMPSIFEEGFSGEQAQPTGELDPAGIAKMMATFALLPEDAFGNMGSVADPNIAASARTIEDTRPAGGLQGQQFEEGYLEAQKASPLLGIWQSGLADVLAESPGAQARVEEMEAERAAGLEQIEKSFSDLKPLSDLLKGGKFKEAFEYAESKGLTDHLMDTKKLKDLRGPFSQEEMAAFFNAIPAEVAKRHTGEGYIFDPSAGVTGSLDPFGTGGEGAMESGFPDVDRAFSRKDTGVIKKVVDVGMQVALTAAGLPPLTAMAAAGVAKAATSGGDLEAALKSAALAGVGSYVGGKVGEALDAAKGAAEAGAGAQAASQAVSNAAKAAGGLDQLAEVVITASRQTLPGALTSVGTSLAGQEALKQSAKGAAEQLEETVVQTQRPDPLEEVVVQSLRKAPPPDLARGLASLGQASVQDILSERQIQEAQELDAEIERQMQEGKMPEEDVIETFRIPTYRLPQLNVMEAIPGLATQIAQAGYRSPIIEGQPPTQDTLDAMEDVVVYGQRPTPPIDLTTIGLGGLTAAQIAQGFTQPNVDPLKGELREPLESQQELNKIQDALASGATIPGTAGGLKSLLEKYGTLENVLKLAGLVSGAGSISQPAAGPGAAPYDPRRGTGQWIDWDKVRADAAAAGMNLNTYVARNWNQIQNRALETGMTPSYNMPVEPGAGDIMGGSVGGYAMGGMPNRVRGPGSGRDDKIPALLSDGEYVIDAETMALLGDGSVDRAAEMMDEFRSNIRRHKGATLARGGISPDAKSPLEYLRNR